MATGPDGNDTSRRVREITQRLKEIEKQLDGETTNQEASGASSAAAQSDPETFEYDPNCPACLRDRHHTREEHEQALARVAQASAPDAPGDEGSLF